jgi:hypothetical protein
MEPHEYNSIIKDLIDNLSRLKERRPSAGRRLLLISIVADMDELSAMLKREVLEKVSGEIWLDADKGIDYAALADMLQDLQPVKLVAAGCDEEEEAVRLNASLDGLVELLFNIADALDRHHKNEDYIKLYEDEMKMFIKQRFRKGAIQSYKLWREKNYLGSPTIEDLEDYRSEKLLKLFKTGIFNERVSSMQRGKRYPDEVVFHVPENEKDLARDINKHYHCLRQICDYSDHELRLIPLQVGIYFYTHRKDANAMDYRRALLKYMTKIDMAQQEMSAMRKRRGVRLSELPGTRKDILEKVSELVGYGEWIAPANNENILEMLYNVLDVGIYDLTDEEKSMSETFWSMLEQPGNLRVVWQNLVGYFAEHHFFASTLGSPALNEMFFNNREYYQNIDKGRPSYQRKSKKWDRVQPLLDRFVPHKD